MTIIYPLIMFFTVAGATERLRVIGGMCSALSQGLYMIVSQFYFRLTLATTKAGVIVKRFQRLPLFGSKHSICLPLSGTPNKFEGFQLFRIIFLPLFVLRSYFLGVPLIESLMGFPYLFREKHAVQLRCYSILFSVFRRSVISILLALATISRDTIFTFTVFRELRKRFDFPTITTRLFGYNVHISNSLAGHVPGVASTRVHFLNICSILPQAGAI